MAIAFGPSGPAPYLIIAQPIGLPATASLMRVVQHPR